MKIKLIVFSILILLQVIIFTQISKASEIMERCKAEASKSAIDFKVAEAVCKTAILLEKDNSEAYFWHGFALSKQFYILLIKSVVIPETKQAQEQRLNMVRESIKDFSVVIDRSPNDVQALVNRGVSHRNIKDYQKAINDFAKALEIDNKFAMAYFGRASVYEEIGMLEYAEKDYSKGLELDSSDITGFYNRGKLYQDLMKKPCLAIPDFKRCHENDKSDLGMFSQYASALSDCGNKKLALQYYMQIASLEVTDIGGEYYREVALNEIKTIENFLKSHPGY